MQRILGGLTVLLAFAGSCDAGVLYSFDATITSSTQPGLGWGVGDSLHGSFIWQPDQATERQSNCLFDAVGGITISSEFSTVIGNGTWEIGCGRETSLFIDLQSPSVVGASLPAGSIDAFDFRFEGPGLIDGELPNDLDALTPQIIAITWLGPSSSATASFQLHRASVPEPATWRLLLASLFLLVPLRRTLRSQRRANARSNGC